MDLEKDILAYMDFKPILKNLKTDLISKPISERLIHNSAENIFYVNFEGLQVLSMKDI